MDNVVMGLVEHAKGVVQSGSAPTDNGLMGVSFPSGEFGAQSGYTGTYPNVVAQMKKQGFINAQAYSLWLNTLGK